MRKKVRIRLPIALAVISACLAFSPGAMAADPGTVEFNPSGPDQYLPAAPIVDWASWGAFTSATCQLSRVSAPTATLFGTTSCSASVANKPAIDTSSAPALTTYLWNTAPLTTGDGTYRVTYTPTFTSIGATTFTRDFVVDATNPVVTASAPLSLTADNTPPVSYSVDDANPESVICAVDPVTPIVPGVFSGFSTCPASPYSLATVSDGNHDFFVVAQDKTGNYGYALKSFTVDATGPVITIVGLTNGEVLTTAWPPLSVGSSDPGTGVQSTTCAYDATTPTQCSDANFLNAPLPDGAHTLTVVAKDFGGNTSSRVISFTIDTSAGLTQGIVAPKTATFKVKRGKLTGGKYPTTFNITFTLPPGAPTSACRGSARINIVVKKKQIGSASAKFKLTSGKCVANGTPKLSKMFKYKRARIGFAYKSGPIKAFTLYGTGKL